MARELSGKDGFVEEAELGTVIVGDGIAVLPEGFYVIKSIGSPTGIPPNSGAAETSDLEVGNLFRSEGALIMETGDDVYPLTMTDLCSLNGWTLNPTSDEFEVGTFCSGDVKAYISGRTDFAGTLTGVVKDTDVAQGGGFHNVFLDVVKQVGEATADLFKKNDKKFLLKLWFNTGLPGEEEVFMLVPAVLTSMEMGATLDENQSFSAAFRPSTLENIKTTIYGFKAS